MGTKPPSYNPDFSHNDPPPPYHTVQNPPTGSYSTSTYIHTTGQPSYGTIPVVAQPISVRATDVIIVGGCPACRIGVLNEEFTLPGLCCAFWFFPLGILCCLAMRERRCTNCGAIFS